MYCNKCGAEIKNEKAQFCGKCGAPVKRPKENAKIYQNRDEEMKSRVQNSNKTMLTQEHLLKGNNRSPQSNLLKKRIATGGCIAAVLIVLLIVGSNLVKNSNEDTKEGTKLKNSNEETEFKNSNEDTQVKNSNEDTKGIDSLRQDISVDNLSAKPIEMYHKLGVEEYMAVGGTVIEATIKNKSDDSVDVSLIIEATIEYKDDYNDEQTIHMQIYTRPDNIAERVADFYCPYSRYIAESVSVHPLPGLIPVGLAPKEEKKVYYYFGGGNFHGYDVDNDNEIKEIFCGTITDLKLIDVRCELSNYVYIPASEWKDEVNMERPLKREDSDIMEAYCTFDIKNNTGDRWEKAGLRMDVRIDEMVYERAFIVWKDKIGIGRGLSSDAADRANGSKSIKYDGKNNHKIEFIPAIMYYKPEKE